MSQYDELAFEVHVDGKTFRIWANGRTEGFGPGRLVVWNHIPALLRKSFHLGMGLKMKEQGILHQEGPNDPR